MEKLVSNWYNSVGSVPENYTFPTETRPGKLHVPLGEGIPMIDLSEAEDVDNRTRAIQKIIKASQEFGFFQAINHGVPEKLMEETISVLKEFFQLPDDAKKDYYSEDFSSSDCILFTSCMNYGNEKVHQWRDFLKHSCHPVDKWQEFWPVNPVRYREIVGACSVEVKKLTSKILELIGEGLGLKVGYFDNELSECIVLSAHQYPPCPDPSLTLGTRVHVDANTITILLQDDVYGLQIYKDGTWLGVDPNPHAFVVNIGTFLQIIWDEIGESDGDRDTMLLQLEQECLDIYRRKVEETRKYKADLFQSLIEAEAEITNILSSLGECASFSRGKGTLKEQMAMVRPFLEDLRSRKEHRIQEFSKIMTQISQISAEIAGYRPVDGGKEQEINDLTVRKLEQLKSHLQELQNEKVLRLQKVNSYISTIHDLSAVMSIDFLKTFNRIHPSLCDSSEGSLKSISNDTLARLTEVIHSLKQDKKQRLQKLQELARSLIELWDLMEIPIDERKDFNHVTSLIPLSVDEVSKQGCLSVEVIEQAELEVERLEILKGSKLKDLVFKRQNELEEIYRGVHMDVDSDKAKHILTGLIESGSITLSDLLQSMDDQIIKAKEEAFSRKDILDKVEKWHLAAEEENWLDEYERDENRYSAVRGAHKNLKRAEKARIVVSKIPSIIENLNAKIKAWEKEKGIPFLYDKVPLLQSLNDFNLLRKQREEEKRKSRELRRQQEQVVEQEGLYIPKSATKKTIGQNTNSNVTGTPIGRRILTPSTRYASLSGKERRESSRVNKVAPVNYVALQKDDSISGNN